MMLLATSAPGEDTLQLEQFEQFDMRTPGAAMGAAYAGAAPAFAAFDRALQARFSMCLLLVLNFALCRKCGVFCEFVRCLPAGSWSCSCRSPVAGSQK